jgi:hypothetical protein
MKALIAAAASFALLTSAALADPPPGKGPHGKGNHGGDVGHEDDVGSAVVIGLSIVFSTQERDTIHQYFERNSYGAQTLPPGIAKNLARGKPLPPGIAKKQLPGDLLSNLPRRTGYDYVLAGSDVLLVEVATHVVTDILRDAVQRR